MSISKEFEIKFLYLIFLTILLIQFDNLAQEGWFWQNPLPQGNNLNDVHIFDDNSAIAIGNTGTIININSNGQIELVRHNVNGKYSKFNCMFFINNDNGWIGGDGFILKTEDGGANWRETNSSELQYNTIFFIDDSTGWIAGEIWGWGFAFGIMLKTTDAGENWTPISENKLCNDFHFINNETGWAIFGYYHWEYGTDYSVWKTSDGGDNWNEISEEDFTTIYFINDTLGWAGGYSQIKKTTDGGFAWQTVIDTMYFCKEIFFEDEENGWALIEEDSIIYTDDGGDTWQGQNINSQDIFELNSFSINNNGFGVGVGNAGHIRTKQPLSGIWEPITQSLNNEGISAIYVLDENNLWVCGGENSELDTIQGKALILHSLDGGNTWDKKVFNDSNPFQYDNNLYNRLLDIYFLDDNYGWAVGENNLIMHTKNAGISWGYQNSGLSNNYLGFHKVFFTDSLHGFIMGGSHILLHTQDGGETWYDSRSNLPTSFDGGDIFFYDSNNGWIVGHNGYDGTGEIYKTENSGQSWQLKRSTNDYWTYKSVQFLDSLVGWVAGHDFNSEVLFTENGGNDWEIIFTYPYPITDFYFLDNNYGWIIVSLYWYPFISTPTYLHYTNNGGLSWEEYLTIPSPNISAIAFANQNTGWVVGEDGAILKTNSGGITAIDNQTNETLSIPNNFQLFQNYPNPFNPVTTISYSLPNSSLVQLKIFNILGQEVATLVNEEKMSGNYKVDFNASNLPSGVYLYKLHAGEFVETKKMILLR